MKVQPLRVYPRSVRQKRARAQEKFEALVRRFTVSIEDYPTPKEGAAALEEKSRPPKGYRREQLQKYIDRPKGVYVAEVRFIREAKK